MKVKEDLGFMYESEEYLKDKLGIKKENLLAAYESVYMVKEWIEDSLYGFLFKDIFIQITDIPILGELAFLGVDLEKKSIIIYVNLTTLVYEYERDIYKKDFFFKEKMSCAEYARFIVLHEFGHIVQASLESKSKELIDSLIEYYEKYLAYYRSIEQIEKETFRKRAYRKIPSEKFADSFAYINYREI